MSWWDRAKTAFGVLVRIGNLDPYVRISELEDQVDELRDERRTLERRVRDLETSLELRGRRIFDHGVYWLDAEGGRDGPYCTRCWDVDDDQVRLHDYGNGVFGCPACQHNVDHPRARGYGRRRYPAEDIDPDILR